MTISNEKQTIAEQLGLEETEEIEETPEPRSITELLRLDTFQDMSDEEIKTIIEYCANQTAEEMKKEIEWNTKNSIYMQLFNDQKARHERIRAKRAQYAILNDEGRIVGFTNDAEETQQETV